MVWGKVHSASKSTTKSKEFVFTFITQVWGQQFAGFGDSLSVAFLLINVMNTIKDKITKAASSSLAIGSWSWSLSQTSIPHAMPLHE